MIIEISDYKNIYELCRLTDSEDVGNRLQHLNLFYSRYLFFLNRRPEPGPMRVQLTNPVSRFKHIQSLQHMCR